MKRIFYIVIVLITTTAQMFGQCSFVLEGHIIEIDDKDPIADVFVTIVELNKAALSDENGYFKIDNVCPGDYHISYSHIGCEDQYNTISISNTQHIDVQLKHDIHLFDDITVAAESGHGHKEQMIDQKVINDNGSGGLGSVLEKISGVTLLKTGSNISKPIVEGLTANRLTLLNNGIAQSGQQWGSDHSPEIDPLMAKNIEVVKGANALQHPQSNRGEVVLLEPAPISQNPKLNGKLSSFYESNGRLFANNLKIGKYYNTLGWRLSGTYRKGGDRSAPNYYLTNTGVDEYNLSLDIRKDISDKMKLDVYASTFSNQLGILRGAHVSSKDQIEEAYTREIPFYTSDNFSYNFESPRQKANHTLVKSKLKYFFTDSSWTDIVVSFQNNLRKEYDIRRGKRSNTPSLSINQYALFGSASFHKEWNSHQLKSGIQLNVVDNTNQSGTGVLPLIPDYLSFEPSLFFVYGQTFDRWNYNLGSRLDLLQTQALVIEGGVAKEVVEYNKTQTSLSISADAKYKWDLFSTTFNLAALNRPAAINEMYSFGLHQGVSGIEEGDHNLKNEQSYKASFGLVTSDHNNVEIEATGFYQYFTNYIYLQVQEEPRSTIRGTFNVFEYRQNNARIMGLNFKAKIALLKYLKTSINADIIRGDNTSQGIPLVYMPTNSLGGGLVYSKSLDGSIKQINATVDYRYSFKQDHLLLSQDVVEAPDSYGLLNFTLAMDAELYGNDVRCTLNIENLLDTSYRDYLNRLRYFSDELGRNIVLGIQFSF